MFLCRDISPTYNRQLFGLANLVAAALPNVLVPLFMGWFTTTARSRWQENFVLNGVIILAGVIHLEIDMRSSLNVYVSLLEVA